MRQCLRAPCCRVRRSGSASGLPLGTSAGPGPSFSAGRRRLLFFLGADACAQCVHEIDHASRSGTFLPTRFYRSPLLLLPHQFDERGLVMILKFLRIEMARLGVDDMAGEFDHFGREIEFWDVLEVGAVISNFVG